ncbi:carbohydrate ABC transporter permease [Paenibacillus roseipurpureus]|uniref:Carbohydrate ABC transporter permease n=1 Tax=Paenibacillus roseopurpureus TaxID=2918901 RepID=A0AA96LQH8_9BACL|nr:carbohydrate ABC transporter permease [Paenibacillus sp. MBLB1832]WNR45436.1 carbohydrate ABC transporter permease [Paenibacillus sp. MBLB1832]
MYAHKKSKSDILFLSVVYSVLTVLSIGTLLPFFQILTLSMSPIDVVNSYGFHFIPTSFDFAGYRQVFHNQLIWISYGNTIMRTGLAILLTVTLTFLGAYPLSKKTLPHRTFWTGFIVLTMFFSGGLIPLYMLVKGLGLMNSMWSLILPGAVSTFLLLIVRNFVHEIPVALEESAKMDGANDIYILRKIILPLSMPVLATVALYTGVHHWNAWFDSMLYIQSEKKQVLQMILRKIVLDGDIAAAGTEMAQSAVNTQSMKLATLVVSIIPIICVYPFLQKYFVKGTLIGSIKG